MVKKLLKALSDWERIKSPFLMKDTNKHPPKTCKVSPQLFLQTSMKTYQYHPKATKDSQDEPNFPLSSSLSFMDHRNNEEAQQRPPLDLRLLLATNEILKSFRPRVRVLSIRVLERWHRRLQQDDIQRLILLLRQKDEKISQFLHQIAQMNDSLVARRRVPVIRIGLLTMHG